MHIKMEACMCALCTLEPTDCSQIHGDYLPWWEKKGCIIEMHSIDAFGPFISCSMGHSKADFFVMSLQH